MMLQISPVFFLAFVVLAVIVPLIGGAILRVMFNLLKVQGVTYLRCWLAYLTAWLTASVLCTALFILLFNVADPRSLHFNLVATVGIGSHLVIVPLVMRVGWGKAALAQVLTIVVYILLLLPAAIPLTAHLRAKAERTMAQNNVRMIAGSMLRYLDDHQVLPADAIYSKDGKKLLSWRVALLPYLEQQQLYQRFRLDEPWDSEHNLALVAEMPAVYRMPGVKQSQPGMTHFQVFVQTWPKGGPGPDGSGMAPFGPWAPGSPPAKVGRTDIFRDGPANTLLAVEATDAVPWTKPQDIPFGPNQPAPKLGAADDGLFAAVFFDLHTRFLPTDIDPNLLRAMATYNGSEVQAEP